jgi:P pilus assembly chaperone PapD
MVAIMKHIIAAAAAAFLLLSTTVQAGIVMGGTRVIYQEGKREASISVTNADVHSPYLVQSWIENYAENDKGKVPFIVTPPLFRLDPEQENVLRINFIGADLPRDRESVFG